MYNRSILTLLTKEFYPINKNYYFAAIQYEISMSIVLIPNIYFLYATLTCTAFNKRRRLKKTVLLFNVLNILYIVNNLIISSYYLGEYHNGGLIRVRICFYMRRIQMLLFSFINTTPLVLSVERYFNVFSKNDLQRYIVFVVFILVNFPSFMVIASVFFQSDIAWIPDEVCTFTKIPTSPTLSKIIDLIFYFTLGIPLIVGIINFFMIKRLKLRALIYPNFISKNNQNKTIFINLIIQTFQPFLGQWPTILFYYYVYLTGNNIYIVWRILDGFTALSLVSNIFLSIIFLKDVRQAIFRKASNKVVKDVTNVGAIKV
uniref:G_PROTEIN_RECEP_F1_2 domain-containing protein n=1 Tax=Strongyloides venezuelensis TaxID=75913 RepID=A0A0K0G4C6_STRVS